MNPELRRDLLAALERPHRLGTIGGDLEEQLAHCASFSAILGELTDRGAVLEAGVDLGTGGGLPGVALAAEWTTMRWLLIDMRTARADEVERTILRLGLDDRVDVRGVEAQRVGHEAAHRERFDVAVARAFGPPSITAECASALVSVGGHLIVSEPPADDSTADRGRWDIAGLSALGFGSPEVIERDGTRFVVLGKTSPSPANIPRLPPRSNRSWLRS